jgi:hypothetical protein
MVWDALRAKNTIQIFGVCLSNLALVVYTAIQIEQIETALQMVADRGSLRPGRTAESVMAITKPMLVAIPCIIAMATVLMVFCAWKLYQEFAWSVLKLIGADYGMKKRLLCYQVRVFFFFPLEVADV